MPKITLPYNYAPRPYQLPILEAMDRGITRLVWAAHRRSGKDKTCLNFTAKRMYERVGAYYYIFPTFTQAKRVIWEGIDKDGKRYLDHFPKELLEGKPNDTEMKLKYRNGSLFQLVGSDNIDGILGTNPVGVVFSEYALQDPRAWGFIRPILAENGGWAMFVSTVRGENHFYDLYELAKNSPDWFCQMDKASETNVIPLEVLQQERAEIIRLYGNDSLYQQEYECNFTVPIAGAYYADNIMKAYADGRVGNVPHETRLTVDTWWDLGINDRMSVWFTQSVGQEIRVIDYYENTGQGFPHYIEKLQEKKYVYGTHTAPHDIEVRELTNGKSRRDTAANLGIRFSVAPKLPIHEGIDAVRSMLDKCWFDQKNCHDGLNALKNYRKEYDEDRKTYLNKPFHDWSSNACFSGDTKVLTRYGICQIMDLPKNGEVLTPCGWKEYQNPRITKRNAQLVAVRFKDGNIVRCTPDHLFLTGSGWKSAESLEKGSLIQSSLTLSRSISMAVYTALGRVKDTMREAVDYCTEMFGGLLLETFQMGRIFITATETSATMPFQTLNVFQRKYISKKKWKTGIGGDYSQLSVRKPETPQQFGIDRKPVDFGIADMPSVKSHGQNGSALKNLVSFVKSLSWHWFDKERSIKSIAPSFARPRIIEGVDRLQETSDVWCLTVPDGGWFSLENGTVVHNCDALRTMATSIDFKHRNIPAQQPDKYSRYKVNRQPDLSPMAL